MGNLLPLATDPHLSACDISDNEKLHHGYYRDQNDNISKTSM